MPPSQVHVGLVVWSFGHRVTIAYLIWESHLFDVQLDFYVMQTAKTELEVLTEQSFLKAELFLCQKFA